MAVAVGLGVGVAVGVGAGVRVGVGVLTAAVVGASAEVESPPHAERTQTASRQDSPSHKVHPELTRFKSIRLAV